MNRTLKWILIIVGTGILLFFGYVFYVFSTFSFDDGKHYSTQDLIDNYNTRSQQINDLKNYIIFITPPNKSFDIEFEGKRLSIFHVKDSKSITQGLKGRSDSSPGRRLGVQ